MRLILGSASPRRKELLAKIGVVPDDIVPADIDETPQDAETPLVYVERLAREKARVIGQANPDAAVLAADTTVAVGRRIRERPNDTDQARAFLKLLSGRRHRVYTAHALVKPDQTISSQVSLTRVAIKRLTQEEIDWYMGTDEWQGKAGGYAIQGAFGRFVPWINGSYTNVMGLDLAVTHGLLTGAGYRL